MRNFITHDMKGTLIIRLRVNVLVSHGKVQNTASVNWKKQLSTSVPGLYLEDQAVVLTVVLPLYNIRE